MGDGDEEGGGGMWNHASSSSSSASYCIVHRGNSKRISSSGNSDSGAGAGGGICALCLQDKLGKLVSSDYTSSSTLFPFPPPPPPPPPCRNDSIHPFFPPPSSSSSSSSPPLAAPCRSKIHRLISAINRNHRSTCNTRGGNAMPDFKSPVTTNTPPPPPPLREDVAPAIANPQLEASPTVNSHTVVDGVDGGHQEHEEDDDIITSRRTRKNKNDSHKKKKGLSMLWSLLPSSYSSSTPPCPTSTTTTTIESHSHLLVERTRESKVARSRSLGCGSRSFSSDFLDRISNGFSDCTLRRVESHREHPSTKSNTNTTSHLTILSSPPDHNISHPRHRRMLQCSRIFGIRGYSMMHSSSSTHGTQNGSANTNNNNISINGEGGRSKNYWGWVYTMASPMRAFHSSHRQLNVAASKSPSPPPVSRAVCNSSGRHNHGNIISHDVLVINGSNDQGKVINMS